MLNYDRIAVRDRAFEELDRVLADSKPRVTYQDVSQALGRHQAFLTNLKSHPDKYQFSLEDLFNLNAMYQVDDIYILKGIRFLALQTKLHQLKALLNTL
jgi:hypothetical protein